MGSVSTGWQGGGLPPEDDLLKVPRTPDAASRCEPALPHPVPSPPSSQSPQRASEPPPRSPQQAWTPSAAGASPGLDPVGRGALRISPSPSQVSLFGTGILSTGGFMAAQSTLATAGGSVITDVPTLSGTPDRPRSASRSVTAGVPPNSDAIELVVRRSLSADARDMLQERLKRVDEGRAEQVTSAGIVHPGTAIPTLFSPFAAVQAPSPFAAVHAPSPFSAVQAPSQVVEPAAHQAGLGRLPVRGLTAHPISIVSTSSLRSSLHLDAPQGQSASNSLRTPNTGPDSVPSGPSRAVGQQSQQVQQAQLAAPQQPPRPSVPGWSEPRILARPEQLSSSGHETARMMWDDSARELDSPGDTEAAGRRRNGSGRRMRASVDVPPQHPKDKQYTKAQQDFIARVKTDMNRPRTKSMSGPRPGAYDALSASALDARKERRMDPTERTRMWLATLESLDHDVLLHYMPSKAPPDSHALKDIIEAPVVPAAPAAAQPPAAAPPAEPEPVPEAVPALEAVLVHEVKPKQRNASHGSQKAAGQAGAAERADGGWSLQPRRFACFACFVPQHEAAEEPHQGEAVTKQRRHPDAVGGGLPAGVEPTRV